MAAEPQGTPCWADATFGDLEGAKRFYGELLGWTYGESLPEYGNYTQAYVDGKAVAALSPPMPGQDAPRLVSVSRLAGRGGHRRQGPRERRHGPGGADAGR